MLQIDAECPPRPGMSIDVNTAMVDYTLLYRIVDDIVYRLPAQSASGPDLISLLLAARDPETGAPMSRRFEADAEQAHPRYAYFPFAGGLRGCIGGHFAMTEAIVAIATLWGRFSVTSESAEIPLLTHITLRPAGPVWCRFELQSTLE